MIKVDISVDTSGVMRLLKGFEKQVPFALQTAINNTAFDLRKRLVSDISAKLERPTKWTTGSVRVEKATKQTLAASVFINNVGRLGATPSALLSQQFMGGARRPKMYELALRTQGLLATGEYTVPGSGAKIDQYGNVVRSQLMQILRALKGVTAKTKRKSKHALVGAIFWAPGGSKGLPKGAWLRTRTGVLPLLLAIRSTSYEQRVPFHDIARDEFNHRWPGNAAAAVQYAVRTAK